MDRNDLSGRAGATASSARAISVPASRAARLTQLGSMTASVAGSMALNGVAQLGKGQRPALRDLLLTPRNLHKITDQLAKMRGAAMKVGQLISMDTGEMLPPELAEIMARLRADAHFMPPAQLKQVLNAAWPKGWLGQFAKFDVRPIAAASIGQVHRARLKDGRDVAIKVQYPGIAQSIDSDVANVGTLIRMSGLLPKGFDLAPYMAEARQQLHEETDYELEGSHLTRFDALLRDDPRFRLPALIAEWTTPQVMVMGFINSVPIEDAVDLPQGHRDRIARDLIDLMLQELFIFGWMQTDPNFANYRYDPATDKIVLLDFGATRQISPAIAKQYRRLIAAGIADDADALLATAMEIGFFTAETDPTHSAQIVHMMRHVFRALLENPLYDFADTTLSQQMQAEGMALADAGFIPPPLPIDILFLQRKFGGMFLLANRLRAKVPVAEMLRNLP
ncbi:AarF/ABC1/UbiB kinase family protein [Cognatiyoonia sp. IB215182]|uniref:ABC1 kinase family protein n=1 Tax=Cognatiyoonia sp. IB215182 TaxID=3097353 RepID=UPI002A11F2CA|nr:AarF/ABC1/UbiB kinase family protein [Cognatiyoonia sp. IB215182]MDX8351826.1 AarF/ABC1/UbiB kinase family protein [Cognatiyoonia sp. IB215182]